MDVQSDGLRLETPRRLEILTGGSGRRHWPAALKAKIVAESFGAVVAEVARRYGARASQVHGWRKDAREGRLVFPADTSPAAVSFTPVVIAETSSRAPRRAPSTEISAIEIEAPGVAVRIRGAADVALVEAIVRALRASA